MISHKHSIMPPTLHGPGARGQPPRGMTICIDNGVLGWTQLQHRGGGGGGGGGRGGGGAGGGGAGGGGHTFRLTDGTCWPRKKSSNRDLASLSSGFWLKPSPAKARQGCIRNTTGKCMYNDILSPQPEYDGNLVGLLSGTAM